MLVKYVKHSDNENYKRDENIGKQYTVLSIELSFGGKPSNFLIDSAESATPKLFDMACFEIVDSRIPEGWVISEFEDNFHRIQPKEFTGDFWDDYYNEDDNAHEILLKVKSEVRELHNL